MIRSIENYILETKMDKTIKHFGNYKFQFKLIVSNGKKKKTFKVHGSKTDYMKEKRWMHPKTAFRYILNDCIAMIDVGNIEDFVLEQGGFLDTRKERRIVNKVYKIMNKTYDNMVYLGFNECNFHYYLDQT